MIVQHLTKNNTYANSMLLICGYFPIVKTIFSYFKEVYYDFQTNLNSCFYFIEKIILVSIVVDEDCLGPSERKAKKRQRRRSGSLSRVLSVVNKGIRAMAR